MEKPDAGFVWAVMRDGKQIDMDYSKLKCATVAIFSNKYGVLAEGMLPPPPVDVLLLGLLVDVVCV
jgi:hypothetical protein